MNFSMNIRSPKSRFLWNCSIGATFNSSEILKIYKNFRIYVIFCINNHKSIMLFLTSIKVSLNTETSVTMEHSLSSLSIDFSLIFLERLVSALDFVNQYHFVCPFQSQNVGARDHQRPWSIWLANISYFSIWIIPFRPCNRMSKSINLISFICLLIENASS